METENYSPDYLAQIIIIRRNPSSFSSSKINIIKVCCSTKWCKSLGMVESILWKMTLFLGKCLCCFTTNVKKRNGAFWFHGYRNCLELCFRMSLWKIIEADKIDSLQFAHRNVHNIYKNLINMTRREHNRISFYWCWCLRCLRRKKKKLTLNRFDCCVLPTIFNIINLNNERKEKNH